MPPPLTVLWHWSVNTRRRVRKQLSFDRSAELLQGVTRPEPTFSSRGPWSVGTDQPAGRGDVRRGRKLLPGLQLGAAGPRRRNAGLPHLLIRHRPVPDAIGESPAGIAVQCIRFRLAPLTGAEPAVTTSAAGATSGRHHAEVLQAETNQGEPSPSEGGQA
jgi:hypothetical protein